MRRVLLGIFTYLEFGFFLAVLWPFFLGSALIHRRTDPGMRLRGRWMRRLGRIPSTITPLWRLSWDGTPPADIHSRPYVVVANHESTTDPFLVSHLPWDMRWIGKEELFKLPLLGSFFSLAGDIPLRRGSGESVKRMLEQCRLTLRAKVPIMIFPEGTRSADGRLLPFKDGAFLLAIDEQVPVLPLVLAGTRDCMPKGSKWFGDARGKVRVLAPVPTTGLTREDLPKLREEVRALIQREVDVLRAELGQPVSVPQPALPLGALQASGPG